MLQKNKTLKISFWLLAILFAILPFHAFFVTFLNYLFFDGTTSAPIFLKMWKEGIIFLLVLLLSWQIFFQKQKLSFSKLDYTILAYIFLGLLSALFITKNLKIAIYGAKYDFVFLGFYLIVKQFQFTKTEFAKLIKILLGGTIIIIIFGLLQKIILPENFLTYFGYSSDHSHFSPDKPLAYCQKISKTDTCRVQSFLSGPNQLGSFLLIVLPLFLLPLANKFLSKKSSLTKGIQRFLKFLSSSTFLSSLRKRGSFSENNPSHYLRYSNLSLFFLGIITLLFTYSRASWLGFAGMFFVGIILIIQNKKTLWKILDGLFITGILSILLLQSTAPQYFHQIIFRPSSTQGHGERMADGIKFSLENPLGLGLGNAGPASNHFAQDYLGFIPESWYLQVSLELGILGIIIYLTILGFTLHTLYTQYKKENDFYALSLLLSLSGIMIASFFLHTWEDSATALIFWGLTGIVFSAPNSKKIDF